MPLRTAIAIPVVLTGVVLISGVIGADHLHVHDVNAGLTPWALFVILLLGPCEPLVPLLMVPAASGGWATVAAVAGVFALATIATMRRCGKQDGGGFARHPTYRQH